MASAPRRQRRAGGVLLLSGVGAASLLVLVVLPVAALVLRAPWSDALDLVGTEPVRRAA